jgi:hypothetical protein
MRSAAMRRARAALATSVLLCLCQLWQSSHAQAGATAGATAGDAAFAGRWDLTITTPTQERASWIAISDNKGELQGLMIGLWGHATPTAIRSAHGEIEFGVPEDEGFPGGSVFRGKLVGEGLSGTVTTVNGAVWPWTGRRAPELARKTATAWGAPTSLFNGKDLSGWTFADPTQSRAWSVEGGVLVRHGQGSEIVTTSRYQDFKLHIEFNCGSKANSGVYLRGRYEVQIETNAALESPNRRIGAVYGFIAPDPALPRTTDTWQSYDITLIGRTITVIHDGQTVIDRREIPGITGGALDSHEDSPGPIYLQGSEAGQVAFRNIVITPAR